MNSFEVNFNDIMSDAELIAEARAAAQKEAEQYRRQKEAEFKASSAYKQAKEKAFAQLKAKFLSEEKAKIDKEFKEKMSKLQSQISSSTPTQKKETRKAKIKRTRKELEQEMQDFVRDKTLDALFQISFESEMYSSDDIYYAIEQGKIKNNPEQALATALEIALENGISLNEIRERARYLVGDEITDSSFNEIFDMYANIDRDEKTYNEIKARNNVIDFNNPADKNTDYESLEEFKKSKSEGLKF